MATPVKSMPLNVRPAARRARWRVHWLALPVLLGALATALALLALARPYRAQLAIGGLLDHAFVRGFYAGETGDNKLRFRWSKPAAALTLPGVGAQSPLLLRLHGDYPGMTVRLDAGGGAVAVPLRSGWQRVALLPRPDRWSGDVRVAIFAPTQKSADDPRVRGVALSGVALRGVANAPPLGQAALLGVSALLITLLTRRATGQTWLGAALGLAAALGGALLLARGGESRLMLTSYSGRLALTLALGGALLLIVERCVRGQGSGDIVERKRQKAKLKTQNAKRKTSRALAGAALLAFLLRFGAMVYPLNYISDLRFSIQRATMVRDGQFLALFLPNPALTPTQWDLDGPIPRSPFYYLVTAPLMYLPGEAAPLAMMAFSASVDALAVLLVAAIARKLGASQRATLCAALLAGIIPLGVQMTMSWGIFPTLLAQCLLLFAVAVWLHQQHQMHTRRGWLTFGAALALAYISYPTALLFGGLLWLALLALLVVRDWHSLRAPAHRVAAPITNHQSPITNHPFPVPSSQSPVFGTLKGGIFAALLALVLFYGWHVPVLVERTLPKFIERFTGPPGAPSGTASVITPGDSHTLGEVFATIWSPPYRQYGALVLGLACGGALLLALGGRRSTRRGGVLLVAWGLVYVPLALMNGYIVTFILKHLLFLLPLLAILGGALLGRLAARRAGGYVVAALLALILWQTLMMEWNAVLTAFTQLK